jgi:hypothetical protein
MYKGFKLKDLERKYSFDPRRVNQDGASSDCYYLGENLIGKTHERITYNYNRLVSEFVKLKRAHDAGLSVPRPEGIFLVMNQEDNSFTPMLVMERLEGHAVYDYYQIDEETYERALRLGNKEKVRAIKIGFNPFDSSMVNMMWNSSKRQTYLFDLDDWTYRDKQKVRKASRKLASQSSLHGVK